MTTYFILSLAFVLILWTADRHRLDKLIAEGKIRKEELQRIEFQLQKERRDAVAELDMIQSRFILFMRLENEVIEKERKSFHDASHQTEEMRKILDKLDSEKKYFKENLLDQMSQVQLIAMEKTMGFPWLAKAYADYFHLQDLKIADLLEQKENPDHEAAKRIREISLKRKSSEERARLYQYLLEFYESFFPWLSEFKDENIEECISFKEKEFLTHDGIDPANLWLENGDLKETDPVKKFQLAIDRYLSSAKSRWQSSKDYERYICYLREKDGWQVSFQPIIKDFPDFFRILVATKEQDTQLILCRFGSPDRFVDEKFVFQLLRCISEYCRNFLKEIPPGPIPEISEFMRSKKISGITYSNTSLTEEAKTFSELWDLKFFENIPLEKFPLVKCNVVEKNGAKVFHLPFDQNYDSAPKSGERNEGYAETVEEAVKKGYRRML